MNRTSFTQLIKEVLKEKKLNDLLTIDEDLKLLYDLEITASLDNIKDTRQEVIICSAPTYLPLYDLTPHSVS